MVSEDIYLSQREPNLSVKALGGWTDNWHVTCVCDVTRTSVDRHFCHRW